MSLAVARSRSYAPPPSDPRDERGGGRRLETPYTRARRERDALLGTSLQHTRAWRAGAGVLAGLLGIAVCGNIYLSTRATVVPHVIEVDSQGAATYRGPAGRPVTPTQAVVRHHIIHFLELARTVTTDLELYRRRLLDARKLLTSAGDGLYNEWGNAALPLELPKTRTTSLEVVHAVPLSKDTWQIDWLEKTSDLSGRSMGPPVRWRGMFKVVQQVQTSQQQLMANPLGIYIDEFHWDRQLEGAVE